MFTNVIANFLHALGLFIQREAVFGMAAFASAIAHRFGLFWHSKEAGIFTFRGFAAARGAAVDSRGFYGCHKLTIIIGITFAHGLPTDFGARHSHSGLPFLSLS